MSISMFVKQYIYVDTNNDKLCGSATTCALTGGH